MNDKDKILELSIENSHYFNLIANLQAENAKLIDCVEHYAKIMEDDYGLKGNSVASQLLKELYNTK